MFTVLSAGSAYYIPSLVLTNPSCLDDGNLSRGGGCKRFYLNWAGIRERLDMEEAKGEGVFSVTPRFHLEQQDGWMDGTAIH